MAERDQNFTMKIDTLEESLALFNKSCLLKQLDVNLELIRRNKESKERHWELLKSVDKDLLKLSQKYHPDKAIGRRESEEEVANAQKIQIGINATRTVLKALTEVFLKDTDIHYKYEFFAKLDINTLINEKQIDLEINNVLCKIGRLSEIKRMNIVGEIRKFLLNCHSSLQSFLHDKKQDFVRHRDNALHRLKKCIDGYEMLFLECKLINEECSTEEDENTARLIQNMYKQSLEESKILQDLQEVAKQSLSGTFKIFPIYEPKYNDPLGPVVYKPVVPKELEYFASPFVFYVDVLLMCSVMDVKRSKSAELKEYFGYFSRNNTKESMFFKEPAFLKAYHLASYFYKNDYKEEVQAILKGKSSYMTESGIRETFKETLKEIEQFLAQEFDVSCYKEGKSNREQFNKRLFKLNDSMAGFNELEKNLQEKFKLYEQETGDIRKECSKLFEKLEKTEEQNIKATYPFHESTSNVATANKTYEKF